MNKLLSLTLISLALVGCASQPAPVVVPQPSAPSEPSTAHQVCVTFGKDNAYCVRADKASNGETHYELIAK